MKGNRTEISRGVPAGGRCLPSHPACSSVATTHTGLRAVVRTPPRTPPAVVVPPGFLRPRAGLGDGREASCVAAASLLTLESLTVASSLPGAESVSSPQELGALSSQADRRGCLSLASSLQNWMIVAGPRDPGEPAGTVLGRRAAMGAFGSSPRAPCGFGEAADLGFPGACCHSPAPSPSGVQPGLTATVPDEQWGLIPLSPLSAVSPPESHVATLMTPGLP